VKKSGWIHRLCVHPSKNHQRASSTCRWSMLNPNSGLIFSTSCFFHLDLCHDFSLWETLAAINIITRGWWMTRNDDALGTAYEQMFHIRCRKLNLWRMGKCTLANFDGFVLWWFQGPFVVKNWIPHVMNSKVCLIKGILKGSLFFDHLKLIETLKASIFESSKARLLGYSDSKGWSWSPHGLAGKVYDGNPSKIDGENM